MTGRRIPLNLGPRLADSGRRCALNLGVPWDAGEEPPAEPVRGTWAGTLLRWTAGVRRASMTRLAWSHAGTAARPWRVRAGNATPRTQAPRVAWGALQSRATEWRVVHRSARSRAAAVAAAWRGLPRVSRSGGTQWAGADRRAVSLSGRWAAGAARARGLRGAWNGRMPVRERRAVVQWRSGRALRFSTSIPWGVASAVPWRVVPPSEPPIPPVVPGRPRGNRVPLNLGCPPANLAGNIPLNLGVDACYAVRPSRRYYVLINSLEVVRLPDRTPIHAESLDMSASMGAYGWDLSMALADAAQLPLLQPDASGPREIEVNVNGYLWTFAVESHSRTRAWDPVQGLVHNVSVTARSRTALLAAPYAPARSIVSDADRQARQLVDDELEFTGFSADYAALNWVVPAGAWFYESTTALDAIARIAAASGAVVLSHPSDKALRIVPRYPVSPWAWTTSTPDHVVLDDVVLEDSMSIRSAPLYDAVIVSGEVDGKGELVRVTREGEAGNLYAQQVTEALINTVPVATERGRNILGDRGEQAQVDLTVPLFPASSTAGPHRVLPMELVQVQAAGGDWMGLATGISITVRRDGDEPGALVVEQALSLERHFSDAN